MSYVSLPAACVAVYGHMSGVDLDRTDAASVALLDRVADAIARVVPVYAGDEQGERHEIPAVELMQGRFTEGGRIFVTRSGAELRSLSVQRADLSAARALLAMAGVSFPPPPGQRGGRSPRRR